MTITDVSTIEGTGTAFKLDDFMAVRARTRKAVHMIAEQITPGMSEDEAKEIARATLGELGMRRGWHHIIVRCGPNTTKDFMERSEPGVVLGENDIFFIDIGPVYGDFEGDAGDTFVFGDDSLHLKAKSDVRQIWEIVRAKWLNEQISGVELYEFAIKTAERIRMEFEYGSLRASSVGLSAFGSLRRPDGGGRLSALSESVGARDSHRSSGQHLRRFLRRSASRRPIVPSRDAPSDLGM